MLKAVPVAIACAVISSSALAAPKKEASTASRNQACLAEVRAKNITGGTEASIRMRKAAYDACMARK